MGRIGNEMLGEIVETSKLFLEQSARDRIFHLHIIIGEAIGSLFYWLHKGLVYQLMLLPPIVKNND